MSNERAMRVAAGSDAGDKLRGFLARNAGLSSRLVNAMLDAGAVRVNGRVERFGSVGLKSGDRIEWCPPGKAGSAEGPPLAVEPGRIIHLGAEFLVYDKAPGYPCQRTQDPARWNLEDAMRKWWGERRGAGEIILAHRLDRDTSGVLLFGLGRDSAERLGGWFRQRRIKKQYLALCRGEAPAGESGEWRHRLAEAGKSGGVAKQGIVRSGGKTALTGYLVAGSAGGFSLWRLFPMTGRTHQLRVQLAAAGHPVVGDPLYDSSRLEGAPHHLLHAARLELPEEAGNPRVFTAPLPPAFEERLRGLGLLKAARDEARLPLVVPGKEV